ncbi:MAG: thioredoxin [Halocynthiibacter sp.]
MLELGTGTTGPATDVIVDVTEANFMQEVVEASQETPVIVDFWAPWCGPCKTLGPMLEAAVEAQDGKVKMAKINVDENQMLAGQMQVQSIPAVYTFFEGKPVDGFQGALPESQIKEFVAKAAELAGDGGLDEAVEMAETMLEDGELEAALETFMAILGEDSTNAAAYAGLVKCYLAKPDIDGAEAAINGAPAEIADAPELETVRAQVELAKQAEKSGPLAELQAAVDANPDDHQARFDLATAMHSAGDTEGAVDMLLALFKRDREWDNGAAKAQLFTIFDALKAEDPIALNGRRKLSSMIFL